MAQRLNGTATEHRWYRHGFWFNTDSGFGKALPIQYTGEINHLCILRQRLVHRYPTVGAIIDLDRRARIGVQRCFRPLETRIREAKTTPKMVWSNPNPGVLESLMLDAAIRSGSLTTYRYVVVRPEPTQVTVRPSLGTARSCHPLAQPARSRAREDYGRMGYRCRF